MIIDFPTALYKTVFPKGEEAGNVTWQVSSTNPPRAVEEVTQFPDAETLRRRGPLDEYDDKTRRQFLDELVYTVTSGSPSAVGSATKQFEAGQILDFETEEELPAVVGVETPPIIDLQHNTNLLDLQALGFSEEEAQGIIDRTENADKTLREEIIALQGQVDDHQTQIHENQKTLNEAYKVRDALTVIQDEEMMVKINEKITALQKQRDDLVNEFNALSGQLKSKYDDLLVTTPLIR